MDRVRRRIRQLSLEPADPFPTYASIRQELRRLSTRAANANHMDVSEDADPNPAGPN